MKYLKLKLLKEVFAVTDKVTQGTPTYRVQRKNVLVRIVDDLMYLSIAQQSLKLINAEHLQKLVDHWRKNNNSISTIRNKISILKWFILSTGTEPDFPTLKAMSLQRPKNKVRAYIDASISDQVFNPLVKSIIDLQFQFGLSHLEAMRIDLGSAIQNDDLFISRKIAHNRKSRYISIMSKSQKLAIKDRQGLTHTHPTFTDIIPEPLLISLYKAELYQCGIKERVDMRHYYARNKLAELERKKVDKDKAYKMVMSDMGFTDIRKLMEFLS